MNIIVDERVASMIMYMLVDEATIGCTPIAI
jgi:hypothetical protein